MERANIFRISLVAVLIYLVFDKTLGLLSHASYLTLELTGVTKIGVVIATEIVSGVIALLGLNYLLNRFVVNTKTDINPIVWLGLCWLGLTALTFGTNFLYGHIAVSEDFEMHKVPIELYSVHSALPRLVPLLALGLFVMKWKKKH